MRKGKGLSHEALVFIHEMKKQVVKANQCGPGRPGGPKSVSGIARACGTAPPNVCLYLKEMREPTFWLVVRIANHLGIDLGMLQKNCAREKEK